MHEFLRSMTLVGLVVVALAACTAMTGKTVGENIDDVSITAEVKAKLAAEQLGTVTRIDVDTNQRTVYLNGTVENARLKTRAAEVAFQVAGVRDVVNNLKIQAP